MKQKVLNVFKPILFLGIGILLFIYIQDIFILDDFGGGTPEKAISGFYALEDNSADVLIFGASHPEFGISPMKLYEKTGIVSYDLSSGQQPLEVSYYMLKQALKTQSPKVVLLDPAILFHDGSNAAWRFVLDKLPLNDVKLEMAADYGTRELGDGYWSALFPILKYHSRWTELTKIDFRPHWKGMYYTAGELLVSQIVQGPEMAFLDSNFNQILSQNPAFLNEFDGTETTSESFENELFKPVINDDKREYMLKIKQLCDENGAELVLVTIPTAQLPWASGSWNIVKSAMMKQFAADEGITYIDLIYDYNLNIDYNTDSFDGGMHMNCRGAQKVTNFLGDYLLTKIQPTGNNELYDEMLMKYNKAYDVAMLESETDFYSYIENLSQRLDKSTIFICANNEYTLKMTQEDYRFLSDKLGVQMAQTGAFTDSYVAVIDKGELLYEAVSNREIDHDMQIGSMKVNLASSGWLAKPNSSVKINGKEYAQGGRGLNIVVYDSESGLVVDSVSFDTYQATKPASRTSIDTYLRAYEKAVCFD